jgi:hypothetical protein
VVYADPDRDRLRRRPSRSSASKRSRAHELLAEIVEGNGSPVAEGSNTFDPGSLTTGRERDRPMAGTSTRHALKWFPSLLATIVE